MSTTAAQIRDDLDAKMALLVPAYTGDLRTAITDGLWTTIGYAVSLYSPISVAGTARQITVSGSTISLPDDVQFPGTNGVRLPRGSTGTRPSPVTGIDGLLRFSTTFQALEYYASLTADAGDGTWFRVATTVDLAAVLADGDKGDITVSGAGATWTIDVGVVTLAKMADMATASLLGRNTAGTGAPEVLSAPTARSLLSLVVGTDVQAYDADLTALAALTGTGIAKRTGVDTWSVGAALSSDLTSIATQTVIGRSTAGTGTGEQLTASTVLDFVGSTRGSILYKGAAGWAILAPSVANKILKDGGVGADPSWTSTPTALTSVGLTATGGNLLLRASTLTVTADRALDFVIPDSNTVLTLGGNLTTAGAYAVTLTVSGTTNVTLPTSGTLITAAALAGDRGDISVDATGLVWTIDSGITLTTPTISGGTIAGVTAFGIRSSGAAFDLCFATSEVLTASRTVSWNVADTNRTIAMGGNWATGGAWTLSGAFAFTGTLTGATTITFPTSGTLETTDAGITSLKAVDTAADIMPYTTAANTWAGVATTAGGRAALGLTYAADTGVYWSGVGTAVTYTLTAFARSLLDDVAYTDAQTTLHLVPGTDVQAYDADLAALAALTATAGMLSRTGAAAFTARTLTAPAAGLTISNPTGSAGDPTFALANDLAAVEGLGTTGFAVRTAPDTWTTRALVAPATGLTISNAAGTAGDPTFALANDLAALEALAGTGGFAARTAADTWLQRTMTGTANRVTVSNGDGIAGVPTFTLPQDFHTAAVVQLGRLGIGLAATATDSLATLSDVNIASTLVYVWSGGKALYGDTGALFQPGGTSIELLANAYVDAASAPNAKRMKIGYASRFKQELTNGEMIFSVGGQTFAAGVAIVWTDIWKYTQSGHYLPIADNNYDIGSAALSVRNIYAKGNVGTPTAVWDGAAVLVAKGGTGATSAAGARTNLELVAGAAGDIWVEKAGDTMTGALVLAAGTATAGSWSRMQSGTVLTTPTAGVLEYDGAAFYQTANTTSDREQCVGEHIFRLVADGAAIGPTIADFFGATSSISLPASSIWELEAVLYFAKTTAGTVTYTIKDSAASYTNIAAMYQQTNTLGVGANGSGTTAGITGTTAGAAALPATPALNTGVQHCAIIRATIEMNAAGNIRIRCTESAGTITPLRGSYYKIRRIPGNIGTFVA